MPSLPLFPPEPQAVQTPPGKGKSKAAKARKKRKAAAAAGATSHTLAVAVVNSPKPDARLNLPEPPAALKASESKGSSPPRSDVLSQSLPSLSSYQNSTPPPMSPLPPPPLQAAASPASPPNNADDGFVVVKHSKRPKPQNQPQWAQHTPEPAAGVDAEVDADAAAPAAQLQFWWNGGLPPPDETWDWEHGDVRRTHKVETWLEALQQLTLDPPETPVIEHVVEPKQSVVPKRVLRQMAASSAQAVPKPKPQVRWGK